MSFYCLKYFSGSSCTVKIQTSYHDFQDRMPLSHACPWHSPDAILCPASQSLMGLLSLPHVCQASARSAILPSCKAAPLSLPLPVNLCHITLLIFFTALSKMWNYFNMYAFLFMVTFSYQNVYVIKALSCPILYPLCLSQLPVQNQYLIYIQQHLNK